MSTKCLALLIVLIGCGQEQPKPAAEIDWKCPEGTVEVQGGQGMVEHKCAVQGQTAQVSGRLHCHVISLEYYRSEIARGDMIVRPWDQGCPAGFEWKQCVEEPIGFRVCERNGT